MYSEQAQSVLLEDVIGVNLLLDSFISSHKNQGLAFQLVWSKLAPKEEFKKYYFRFSDGVIYDELNLVSEESILIIYVL